MPTPDAPCPGLAAGLVNYREYADNYYGDFLDYTRAVRGRHALIMSRPVDSQQVKLLGAELVMSFSPRRVVLSGWVGDQDPTWGGLQVRRCAGGWGGRRHCDAHCRRGSAGRTAQHYPQRLARLRELWLRHWRLPARRPAHHGAVHTVSLHAAAPRRVTDATVPALRWFQLGAFLPLMENGGQGVRGAHSARAWCQQVLTAA